MDCPVPVWLTRHKNVGFFSRKCEMVPFKGILQKEGEGVGMCVCGGGGGEGGRGQPLQYFNAPNEMCVRRSGGGML